jgi:hypothetical protein
MGDISPGMIATGGEEMGSSPRLQKGWAVLLSGDVDKGKVVVAPTLVCYTTAMVPRLVGEVLASLFTVGCGFFGERVRIVAEPLKMCVYCLLSKNTRPS